MTTYAGTLSGIVALLLTGVLGMGCRPAAEKHEVQRPRLPLTNPQAATYLVEAQQALRQGAVGAALALVDSAEHHARPQDHAFLADVAFLRGRIQTELNHADEATTAYKNVLSFDPEYRGAWLNMGNLAFRQGRLREALGYYRHEYEAYGDPKILVYMGHAYAELGKVDSARYEYERALAQDDSLAEAYIRLAVLYEEDGEMEKALSHARRALALKPDDPDYRYIVGNTLLQNGKPAEAEAQLRRTIEQQPWHAKAHYSLGMALARLGRPDEAERYLAKVDSLQQVEQSIDTFERRTRLYPDDPAAWATYGYALQQIGRDAEAMKALQVALHLSPVNPDVHFLLANLYMKHRQPERALGHYQFIVKHDTTVVDAWINLGVCLARLGKQQGARQAWETALRLEPNHPQAKQYLASLPPSP